MIFNNYHILIVSTHLSNNFNSWKPFIEKYSLIKCFDIFLNKTISELIISLKCMLLLQFLKTLLKLVKGFKNKLVSKTYKWL